MTQVLLGTEQLYAWQAKTPVSVADVVAFGQVSLDVANMNATVACPTTPTFTILPTINALQNISYDASTGIITFMYTRPYVIVITLNCSTAANRTLYGYGYINKQDGNGFVPIPTSGRQKQFASGSDGQVNFQSANIFQAGWQLKLGNFASGAMNFVTDALPGLAAISTPALRVLITG